MQKITPIFLASVILSFLTGCTGLGSQYHDAKIVKMTDLQPKNPEYIDKSLISGIVQFNSYTCKSASLTLASANNQTALIKYTDQNNIKWENVPNFVLVEPDTYYLVRIKCNGTYINILEEFENPALRFSVPTITTSKNDVAFIALNIIPKEYIAWSTDVKVILESGDVTDYKKVIKSVNPALSKILSYKPLSTIKPADNQESKIQ
ncbi:hypothetical protein [Kiloniella majae]|uniref:hypothetical protein n=1 Tax=Kiloniella majae TaxID=1938558 RepID=UPI000A276FA7|nr:hypothetical protein [Kiloniella majae]